MEKSKKSTNLILLTVWIIVFCIVNYICLSTLHAITSGDFEYFSRQSRLQNNHKNRWMNQGKGTRYSTSIDDIHGVYVNASKLTSNQLVNQFLNSISGTNINAIVLDIKTERGTINFRIQNKTANQIGAVTNTIPNIENLIALLHEKNYYVIGRIVTFMDPMLAKSDKSLAVVSDPANLTDLCGTHDDILIPSSCLNAVVTGLISRTFLRDDIIASDDFHGAAYYENPDLYEKEKIPWVV